ncbi:hypothetical protein ACFLTQ_02990 [Chloroflexota bacterium]
MGVALALFSLAMAFLSLYFSHQSDAKYTENLTRIDANVAKLEYYQSEDSLDIPDGIPQVVITPPTVHPKITGYPPDVSIKLSPENAEISKVKAQARLDADKARVGYVRGELYRKDDDSWAISWGGKYPL